MPWIIAYDIENDKLRTKAANRILEDGLIRLQKSVFVGDPKESVLRDLMLWLEKNTETVPGSSDQIILLPCTQRQLETAVFYGVPPADWKEMLHPPNTLII